MPNGFEADGTTPKFDEVITTVDLTTHSSVNTQIMVFYKVDNTIGATILTALSSGTTQPSGTGYWYDTTNNIIRRISNGAIESSGHSFPLAILTCDSTQISSIDQVFDSFGYIGSTVFALPGIKGLIPNGRNEDGSLKNTEFVTENLLTYTFTSGSDSAYLAFADNGSRISYASKQDWDYDEDANFIIWKNAIRKDVLFAGSLEIYENKITAFNPKTRFQAVDRNDSSWLSGLGMPSNKYIDLTLGASSSQYTAPANGWVYFNMSGTNMDVAIVVGDQNNSSLNYAIRNILSYGKTPVFIPVRKGETFWVTYSSGTTNAFRFYYAEGEQ